MATALAESSDRKTCLSFAGRRGLCRAARYSRSQLEPPPSLTAETKVWDSRPNGVQKQRTGFHRSQSFEARPKTCTSEQIKTCAAGTLRSNPFLQQSWCSGGNTAPPTASGPPQPAPGETPLPQDHRMQATSVCSSCSKDKKM